MQIVYVGPHDEVEVAVGYDVIVAVRGEAVTVPDSVAKGEPPRGEPGDLDFWPGTSGLLAQDGLWARPQTKAAKAATETKAPEEST